jgi:hypothetical protein
MRYSKLHTTKLSWLPLKPPVVSHRPSLGLNGDHSQTYYTMAMEHPVRSTFFTKEQWEGQLYFTIAWYSHSPSEERILQHRIVRRFSHLEEATAASFSISGPEEEAAAPFQNLSTLAPLPAVTLEFLQHHRSSATFVHPELSLTASSTVFTDCPHCPFGQTSEIHSTLQLLSPLMFASNTSLVRNSQPWNLCIPVLGDSPLRSR